MTPLIAHPDTWMGQIVTFYGSPKKAVIGCVPQPGNPRLAGEVVGTFPVPAFGSGKIPDLGLLVRGRSGRKIKISVVEHYVRSVHNYREADAENQ